MEQDVSFYVYIVASGRNGTLYIGMTDDLVRRVWMHREGILPGFTKSTEFGLSFGTSNMKRESRLSHANAR